MKDDHSASDGRRRFGRRADRSWRRWLWGLSSWLTNGGIVAAFYLALRTSIAGTLAVVAFGSGFLLKQVLEATSQGD